MIPSVIVKKNVGAILTTSLLTNNQLLLIWDASTASITPQLRPMPLSMDLDQGGVDPTRCRRTEAQMSMWKDARREEREAGGFVEKGRQRR